MLPALRDLPLPHFKHALGGPRTAHIQGVQIPRNDPHGFDVRVSDAVLPRAASRFRQVTRRLETAGFKVKNVHHGLNQGTFATAAGVEDGYEIEHY